MCYCINYLPTFVLFCFVCFFFLYFLEIWRPQNVQFGLLNQGYYDGRKHPIWLFTVHFILNILLVCVSPKDFSFSTQWFRKNKMGFSIPEKHFSCYPIIKRSNVYHHLQDMLIHPFLSFYSTDDKIIWNTHTLERHFSS